MSLTPDDVAFLTYTSGTTGPSKGAMNSHGNVVFNSQTYRDWIGLTGDDVVFGTAPFFHITGLIGHLTVAMLVGMPLVMGYRFDPDVALELIERHGATFTVGAITAFIAMLNAPSAGRARPVEADEDRERRRPDRAGDGAGVGAEVRRLHPQHLRAHRDDLAVALRPVRQAGARRPRLRRAVGRRSGLQHARARRRRRRQRRRARGRSASSSRRARRSSRATGTSPRRPSTRSPAASCTPATSA